MDFGPTAEQQQLAESERSWLTRHDPIARLRSTLDTATVTVDPAAVAHAADSGLLALLTPEMGGTNRDLAVLTEEHGYAASSLPLADLALAAWTMDRGCLPGADRAAQGVLTSVARGPIGSCGDDGLRLSGVTSPVPMAADADCCVVVGEYPGGEYAALVHTPTLVGMNTLDLSRSWARVSLDGPVQDWATLPDGSISFLRDALAVHRSLDAFGAAARLLDMTVTYAGQREQFGALIGSFQAVKHHCADMAVAIEAGRSVLGWAALALDGEATSRHRAASAAAAFAKAGASRVASTALQVHGGIGFTWEHDLHVYLRRIKVDEAFDGTVAEHRASLVAV